MDKGLLDAGRDVELRKAGLSEKEPVLLETDEFELDVFGTRFDFGIAQSVFTHLPVEAVRRCLSNVAGVMVSGGRFYATFFESVVPRNRDPFRYPFGIFQEICEGLDLTVKYIGKWSHPRNQRMIELVKV